MIIVRIAMGACTAGVTVLRAFEPCPPSGKRDIEPTRPNHRVSPSADLVSESTLRRSIAEGPTREHLIL